MKIVLKIIVVLVFLSLLGYSGWYFIKKADQPPVVYETQTPSVQTIIKKTVATGSVVPRKEILIKPRVSGIVEKLYVQAGESVTKGQQIAKVRIIPDMARLNSAENNVEKAQLNYDDQKLVMERQQKLYADEVIAKAEFQQFELAYKNSKQELEAAREQLQIIKEGASKQSGQPSNTVIRSTVDGMVLDVPVKEGNSVIESNTFNEGTTIAIIANMQSMIFQGNVDESEVGKIKEGMDIVLNIGAIENQRFSAQLEYISPKGVEKNGAIQFEIKAALQLKEDHFIRAGYSANADIVLDRRDSVLAIAESLLQFDEQGEPFIEVETAPQQFEQRPLELGLSDGIQAEVLSGVTKADKIKVAANL